MMDKRKLTDEVLDEMIKKTLKAVDVVEVSDRVKSKIDSRIEKEESFIISNES